jgi:hypothetical protein
MFNEQKYEILRTQLQFQFNTSKPEAYSFKLKRPLKNAIGPRTLIRIYFSRSTSGPVDDECDAFDVPTFERTSRTTVRHVLAGAKKELTFGSGGPKSVVPGTDVADEKKKCDDMIKSFLDGTSCNKSTHKALTSVFNRMIHINTKDTLCDMARNIRCDSASFIRVNLSLSLPLHPFLSPLQMK